MNWLADLNAILSPTHICDNVYISLKLLHWRILWGLGITIPIRVPLKTSDKQVKFFIIIRYKIHVLHSVNGVRKKVDNKCRMFHICTLLRDKCVVYTTNRKCRKSFLTFLWTSTVGPLCCRLIWDSLWHKKKIAWTRKLWWPRKLT